MKLPKITLVTGNNKKAEEVQRILNIPLDVKELDLDEIQETNLEKVALNKLNRAFKIVGGPVVIDDVSFEIDAWDSFPGPLIKWMLKDGIDPSLVIKLMKNEPNRKAVAKLAIGFHDGKKAHLFIGAVKGVVAEEIRGNNGFGWDRIFIPEGHHESFAEMDPEVKDSISHRRNALDKFKDFINKNYEV
jgi:XTP/dITP diphosphohydrolase